MTPPDISLRFSSCHDSDFQDYLTLRDTVYRAELGYSAPRDAFDDVSEILFVSRGHQVIGGARLAPRTSIGLPLEHNGFELATYLEGSFIDSHTLFEVGRIAILPAFRSFALSVEVFRAVRVRIESAHNPCVCTISPRRLALMTKRFAREIDCDCRIIRNIRLGPISLYHHLGEMCICVITDE